MLKYVSINLFGPAYVLMVHYEYFLRVLKRHACKDLNEKIRQAESLGFIGGVLDDTTNLDLSTSNCPELIKIGDGKYIIRQSPNSIFFSSTTNMMMDWAVAFVMNEGKRVPVLVQLKEAQNYRENVRARYIGDVVSLEHNLIGYNLDGYEISTINILNSKQHPI